MLYLGFAVLLVPVWFIIFVVLRVERATRRTNRQIVKLTKTIQSGNREMVRLRERIETLERRTEASRGSFRTMPVTNAPQNEIAVQEEAGEPLADGTYGDADVNVPDRIAVDYDGHLIKRSPALEALGILEAGDIGDGMVKVFLNQNVTFDHISLEKWAKLYHFTDRIPYRQYRTLSPALVRWDPHTGVGEVVQTGVGEVCP
jgi:hypothetical protein